MEQRFMRELGVASLLIVLSVRVAAAHELSRSISRLEVQNRQITAVLILDLLELADVDVNGDDRISYVELDEAIERIYGQVKQHFQLRAPDAPLTMSLERYTLIEDEHVLQMELMYRFEHDITEVHVTSTLHRITKVDHRHLVRLRHDGHVDEAILDARRPEAVFTRTAASTMSTIGSFLRLGIEHIFTGYDHLAFLVGLLMAQATLLSLVQVVASFTVAHSITLALATFDIVVLPTRLTESLIALSIAYVALENLLGFRFLERYRVTFLFGLVHGFGFSNILREMRLPRGNLALSLFSFNTGVEIGQTAFIALAFPALSYFMKWRPQTIRSTGSAAVLCVAVYWFVQRAFF